MNNWSVYLLRCSDGSLYCGVTTDIKRRLRQHNAGTASKYTRSRLPAIVQLVAHGYARSDALKLEHRIKRVGTAEKLAALFTIWFNRDK